MNHSRGVQPVKESGMYLKAEYGLLTMSDYGRKRYVQTAIPSNIKKWEDVYIR